MAEKISTEKHLSHKPTYLKSVHRYKRSEKFKKFKGNKTEGQGFADKRKKKIQYEYLKVLKKEGRKHGERKHMNHEEETDSPSPNRERKHQTDKWKYKNKAHVNRYTTVEQEAQKRKDIKHTKKQEAQRRKHERDEATEKYRKKKKDNFKKLCRKTRTGQPLMKCQIEYLLSKIEKQVNQT